MKRLVMFFVLALALSFVSASVSVHNITVDIAYSPFENLSGEINLTIEGEGYDDLITSNDNDSIGIGDFLNASGVLFGCSPPDCSKDYTASSGGMDNSFDIGTSGKSYLGFVLNGDNVELTSMNFKVESNFEESSKVPLTIDFFERENWKYEEFSNDFLNENWGCYNPAIEEVGPVIGSLLYCEMVSVPDSGVLKVGAKVSGVDDKKLNMEVCPEGSKGGCRVCDYNTSVDSGCTVFPDEGYIFSEGDYRVCVSADTTTNYRIFSEDGGENCGFTHELMNPEDSVNDYAIFAQTVKYDSSLALGAVSFDQERFVEAANDLLEKRYGNDCSDGCILPIAISGIPQDVRVYDVALEFVKDNQVDSTNQVYDLSTVPVLVDYSGVVDLGALGFSVSKTMEYIVSLSDVQLLKKKINILPAPIILNVFPLDPPAGVPVNFYVNVDFDANKSLTYDWDFGDGTKDETGVPYALHSYGSLGNYTMTVEVSAGGNLTSEKSFNVVTVSPEFAVNSTLISKRKALKDFVKDVSEFPSWYSEALSKLADVDFFDGELDRLDRARNNSFSESDFIKVAEELYDLNVPKGITINSFTSPYLMTEPTDINIEPVATIGGGSTGASNSVYQNPILVWQEQNVVADFETKGFSVVSWKGEINEVFRIYSMNVESSSYGESYFVINKPFNDLYFNGEASARKAGNATVIILNEGVKQSFGFYYKTGEETSFFVSPKLSSVILEGNIEDICDYDFICEEEMGENSDTCRNDCKPVFGAILYVILSLIFLLIIYSVLQIWYKHRYEGHLFRDRRQLYNLLMYVTNARARGMSDDRIAAELRKQGWSTERVNYIIKKSRGQRTGLYEIIPFEKISAFFRNRKAQKIEAAKVATGVRQQDRRNINKSGLQRKF